MNHFGIILGPFLAMQFLSIRLSLRHLQVSVFRTPWPQKRPAKPPVRAIFFRRDSTFFAHIWVHFLTTFWQIFGPLLGVSLGVSWEPSRASWGSLGRPLDPKTLKNLRFFKVFENAAFWLFEAPDGSLGLILPPLWPIWSQNGPQNGSQKCSKKEPTIVHVFFYFSSNWMLLNIKNN